MELGTLNLQNAGFYESKIDSCLKLPFLEQIERSMISISLLALFCHHFQCFPVTEFCMFSLGWYFCSLFWILVFKWLPKPAPPTPFRHHFSILVRPCSERVSLKVVLLVLVPFWLQCSWFWIGFHFGIENLSLRHSNL